MFYRSMAEIYSTQASQCRRTVIVSFASPSQGFFVGLMYLWVSLVTP
jgi:hypothetical protein